MRLFIPSLTALSVLAAFPVLAASHAGKTFGDWAVECERAPGGETRCFLSQTQLLKESNARLLKTSVGYLGPKEEPMLVLLLPLGVDLRAGIALKVDDSPQLTLVYQQCVQDGCMAAVPLNGPTLAALRKAKRIQVGMMPYASTQTMTVNVSPNGLASGMDALR
ncbi:invasion associated locus B family protein [Azospirillum soli]|uniref:invasion associated locus B family protein n=1 Tax=Azospirillum soli TaxID=1304799 RepID=UPI001AEA5350|nr:invasion associated locus B family protein [Azospirillum soli]MBP2316712.1 invasion protein IalB [Azospirillum soli]